MDLIFRLPDENSYAFLEKCFYKNEVLKRFILPFTFFLFVCSKKKEAKKKGTTKTNRERDFAAQSSPASPSLSRFALLLDPLRTAHHKHAATFHRSAFSKIKPEIEQKFSIPGFIIFSTILNVFSDVASELTGKPQLSTHTEKNFTINLRNELAGMNSMCRSFPRLVGRLFAVCF